MVLITFYELNGRKVPNVKSLDFHQSPDINIYKKNMVTRQNKLVSEQILHRELTH